MRLLRIVLALGLLASTTLALALPNYMPVFKSTYRVRPGSPLEKAGCVLCHLGPTNGGLNPYGADVKRALGSEKMLTAAMLHRIDALDSDRDGVRNIVEIRAGSLPGDPKSKPGAAKKPAPHKKPPARRSSHRPKS